METIIIDDRDGQRLDNYLFQIYKSTPNSHVYRMLRKGRIRINGKVCKDNKYKLSKDDVLSIPTPVNESLDLTPSQALITRVSNMIVRDESDFWLLNKQPGICVHKSEHDIFGVIEVMQHIFGEAHLVHRIDRNTSGCLLIAKSYSSLSSLQQLWRDKTVVKVYQLLSVGQWQRGDSCTVEKPLLRTNVTGGGAKVIVSSKGKPAKTTFRLLQQFDGYALLEATIETGRTHQIRVHAASIGHAIVGDGRYGVASNPYLSYMFLHASSLILPGYHLKCDMTEEQTKCLKQLAS